MASRPLPSTGFAWWHGAATGGGDAACSNCGFMIPLPPRCPEDGPLTVCRLKRHGVNPKGCCIQWLDATSNSSPRDAIVKVQREMMREYEILKAANALGTPQAWETVHGGAG